MNESLPVSAERRLDEACTRFEAAWQAAGPDGPPPRIADYLAAVAGPDRHALLRELLLLDVHYRRRRGQSPGADDYAAGCPADVEAIRAALAEVSTDPTPDDQATTDAPLLAGRYQVLEQLGQGGMGTVFRARDAKLDRPVGLKMLPEGTAPDADAVRRFRREAKALARLSHPGIIQAYDSGEDGGKPFLVMELVEGQSLAAVLRDQGRVSPARAADFAYQAALALHHAHKSGLVHRDVKPSNLLLSADGRVQLLDLGLARFLQDQIGEAQLTRTGTGMGTPDYCPPEQFRDARKADARSDVYALGCTLYHLIAGRVPFPGSSFSEKVEAHETKEPQPLEEVCPEVPAGLALAVRRMMAKRPADRFPTMANVAEALMPHVAGSSASFPQIRDSATWDGSRLATVAAAPRRRRPVAMAGAAAAALLLAGVVGLIGFAAGWFGPGAAQVARFTDTQPEGAPRVPAPDDGPKAPAAADDPNVLTVAQQPGAAKYQTIGAALAAARAGQTVRVLDSTVYRESVRIAGQTERAGITLEATGGATLTFPTAAENSILIEIAGVPNVSVRGFHLRATEMPRSALVVVRGACPGLWLEGLELEAVGSPQTSGVEYHPKGGATPDRAPVVIRDCDFRGLVLGVELLGEVPGATVFRTAVRSCLFADCLAGVLVVGSAREVQVVGNRFHGMRAVGVQFQLLAEDTESVLVANNTTLEGAAAFTLRHRAVNGKDVQIRNNLVLGGEGMDMLAIDSNGGPGNVVAVAEKYRFGPNWREGKERPADKGWIRPDLKRGDVLAAKIDGVNRDPKSPDFLRPNPKSQLATAGAGNEDPSLPRYVGALPPEGVEPWDWDRAWRMPKDAQLLTVSKNPKDKAQYSSIGAALKDAKPWATIRVLDQTTYPETLLIGPASQFANVTLEAPQRATIAVKGLVGIKIINVPGFTLRGFKLHGGPGTRFVVSAEGRAGGTVLENLELSADVGAKYAGVNLEGVQAADAEPQVIVRNNIVRGAQDGIRVSGMNNDMTAWPCRRIAVRGNSLANCAIGIYTQGLLQHVQVVGNRVRGASRSGVVLAHVLKDSEGVVIANNTVFDSNSAFDYFDDVAKADRGKGVVLKNNLILACPSDMVFINSGGHISQFHGPGDGKGLYATWHIGHNGREIAAGRKQDKGWIPLAPSDLSGDHLQVLSRDPDHPNFLRPGSSSPLSRGGAGPADPSLPVYIGAAVPEGAEPWDWDRTWRMRMKKTGDQR
jgi:nitrous oxidase accessory protein NosD